MIPLLLLLQGAMPSRQTLKPGAPLSDRNRQTILKTNKYRGSRGVPDTISLVGDRCLQNITCSRRCHARGCTAFSAVYDRHTDCWDAWAW